MPAARLTYASTATSSDAYYIAGMPVADAFPGFELRGKLYAVASSLELGNFRKHSHCHKVYSYETFREELGGTATLAKIIALAVKKSGGQKIEVGADFSAKLFLELKKLLPTTSAPEALFPERAVKSAGASAQIKKANRGIAAGIALCAKYLKEAKIQKGFLIYKGQKLTSEFLRTRVQELFLKLGLTPANDLIIAGGAQACDPHCQGYGPLKANDLIIVDLFSPLQSSHYWGDMTRTFLRGKPSAAQVKLVQAVAKAQKLGICAIKPGASGVAIHKIVAASLEADGFRTLRTKNGYEGFFHGTGHSLGLDCHDVGTGINSRGGVLRAGNVITVEPGLYYPSLGGCRIEDNGVVTQNGFKLLSHAPYDWVL